MRQYDVVDKIGLSRDCGRFPHDPHPIGETGLAERLFGMIGIAWRQLPQSLLPPHRSDQEAKNVVADVGRATLVRDCRKRINRDRYAGEAKNPKYSGCPSRLQQKIDDIGNRVGVHRQTSLGQSIPASSCANRRQARAAAAITLSASELPSASPFSKSPSLMAIWFVTWAKHKTGLPRARANA